jgi:hypothetical protein
VTSRWGSRYQKGRGKASSTLLSRFDAASADKHASVSNSKPQFPHDQILITKRSLTNSDLSGAISVPPHFSQVVPNLELGLDIFVNTVTSLVSMLAFLVWAQMSLMGQ